MSAEDVIERAIYEALGCIDAHPRHAASASRGITRIVMARLAEHGFTLRHDAQKATDKTAEHDAK